jgi:hypothetical protein
MSGGGGGTQTTNANTNTNSASASLTINQSVGPDVTQALQALAGSQQAVGTALATSQQAQAQLYSYAMLQGQSMDANALRAVAQSVSSLNQPMQITGVEWVIAIVSILGFLITAKVISLKQLGFK